MSMNIFHFYQSFTLYCDKHLLVFGSGHLSLHSAEMQNILLRTEARFTFPKL